jgi:ribose transport system permease protein
MTNNRLTMPVLRNMPLILFVLVFVLFSLLDERFFRIENFSNIVETSAFVGLLAVGMTAVLLTGGIDLSVGATMYITAAVVGTLLQQDVNYIIAILAGIVAGTSWGFVNAFLVAKVGLVPFVATLATLTVGRGIGLLLTESRQFILPQEMAYAATDVFGLPLPVVVLGIVVVAAVLFLRYTAPGRQIYAMGNDREAAKKAGLNVIRLTGSVYVISGFCASLAGVIAISQQGSISAGIGEGVEFRAIAAAVLGGTSLFGGIGNVFPGTIIGVLLVQMISTGLVYLQVDLYLQDMVAAAVIFFAVFVDAQRMRLLSRLERRNIRVEKGDTGPPDARPQPAPS